MPSTLIVGEVIHTHDLSSYNFAKGGAAKSRIFGSRGVWGGGSPPYLDTLDYVTIGTSSNANDFGNLTEGRNVPGATSDGSRGVFGGGQPPGFN